jgi:DNA-binding transcriptional ArsR family regulator
VQGNFDHGSFSTMTELPQSVTCYLTIRLNTFVPEAMTADRLSATFHALADPTRRAILARLTTGEASVNELAAPFNMSLPAISKHLKVLEYAQLISRTKEAQYRPCKLEVAPLQEADNWIEQYRRMWEERFDRLDDYLMQLQAKDEKTVTAKGRKGRPKRSKGKERS